MAGALFKHHLKTDNFPSFIELIYLVTKPDFVKNGFGTKVLRRLKSQLFNRDAKFIVVYSANTAIDFFKKQGFKLVNPTVR